MMRINDVEIAMSERRDVSRWRAIGAVVCIVAFGNMACYNSYFISKPQLQKLEASVEQRSAVAVVVDGCDVAAGASPTSALAGPRMAQAEGEAGSDGGEAAAGEAVEEGIDPATGCPTVKVNTASPLRVVTTEGSTFRVTPFNFAMTDSQLVSPDYDLLLPIDEVEGAEVQTFSGLKTGLMIGGGVATAVATFVILALTAGEERGFGQE